jgi:hypothetical protein
MMDNQKIRTGLGDLSAVAFLFSAIYFIWATTSFTSLFSISHISFLIIGYIISKFILGWLLFLIIKIIEKPFDYFDKKFPNYLHRGNTAAWIKFSGFISQIIIYIVIFHITKYFYINLFTQEYEVKHPPLMRIFHCPQFKNDFTLGKYSNPSDKQIEDLCSCIDKKLTDYDKANLNSKIGDISADNFWKSFKAKGDALKHCGGYDL